MLFSFSKVWLWLRDFTNDFPPNHCKSKEKMEMWKIVIIPKTEINLRESTVNDDGVLSQTLEEKTPRAAIHFFTHLFLLKVRVVWSLCLSPAVFGWEEGYNLDRSPVHHKDTYKEDSQTSISSHITCNSLEKPINLPWMFLVCGRKLENPKKTNTLKGININSAEISQSGVEPANLFQSTLVLTNCSIKQCIVKTICFTFNWGYIT